MTVLITGASRGIGRALADLYRTDDEDVIGTARKPGEGEFVVDMADPSSISAMGDALDGKPIDTLICNAGIYLDKGQRLESGFTPEAWSETFAVNVTAVFLTIQTLLPNLRAANGAKIAIISSRMGSDALAPGGSYIYRSSKAAVLNLGRNLAMDLRSDGIAVGIYHPGWVRTDMGSQSADISVDDSVAGMKDRIANLSLATTGIYETFDGEELPF